MRLRGFIPMSGAFDNSDMFMHTGETMSEKDDRDFSDPESQGEAKPSRCSKVRASRIVLALALTLGMLGCRSSTDPSKTETLNLAGNWSGTSGTSDVPPNPTVATLTQNGSAIGGTFKLREVVPCTLSGSISGSVLTLTIDCPAGGFAAFGSATCSTTATETFVVSATSIKKIFTFHWSPTCVPTVSPVATSGIQVTLTKQ